MTDDLMTAFDDSLNALAAGDSLGAALARYPHLGDDLRPMLEAAQAARQIGAAGPVPHAAQRHNRAQFLTGAAELRGRRRPAAGYLSLAGLKPWAIANRALAVTAALVVGLTLGTFGVLTASAESLPGEPLYGLKRSMEQTQLLLSFDQRAREELATDFSERRVNEVRRLLANAQAASVEFGGVLEQIAVERWTVAGIAVVVPDGAEVLGTPVPGLYVEIDGRSQTDGTVVATRVEVTGLAFTGTVRARSAETWQVDDVTLFINDDTTITGAPQPGDWVSVSARRQLDGTWLALHIAFSPTGPDDTPATVPTPTTAVPTATPSRTATPPPSATAPVPQAGTEVRFNGVVEAVGAQSWQIGGQTVRITAGTELRDNPQVGQRVAVRALRAANGALTALRIELDDSGPSPSSTPGSSGPGPTPTDDDGENEAPDPTHTPGGGGGPGPSASNTPKPEETDEPDDDSGDGNGGDSQERRWEGTLEAVNGSTWVIGGQAVMVTGGTEIRDDPRVGDQVEVRAIQQGDWSLLALRIEKKD